LLYAFVPVFSKERLQSLHSLGREQSVAIPTVVIVIVRVVVVIDIAQRKEHVGTTLSTLTTYTCVQHCPRKTDSCN
jgi:hypothetical protein